MPSDRLPRRVCLRHDRAAEAVLGGLAQSLLAVRYGPDLACQAELTEHHEFLRQRRAAHARTDRRNHGEVGGGLGEPHAADHIDEHVVRHAARCPRVGAGPRAAVQRDSTRNRPRRGADLRAWLGSTSDWTSISICRVPSRATVTTEPGTGSDAAGKEDRRRIADLAQALLIHREHADLIDRAKAVLDRANHPETAAGIAFEIKHRVHHVLEHAGTRDDAFTRHVTDQQHGRARSPWRDAPDAPSIRAAASPRPGLPRRQLPTWSGSSR